MRGAVLYGPRDIRFEDARFRKSSSLRTPSSGSRPRACAGLICRPYRGIQPTAQPTPMGHEYCGIVEEVGRAVKID